MELLSEGEQLAQAVSEKTSAENDKASAMSQFKARIDAAAAKISTHQQHVSEKAIWKDLDCDVVMDVKHKTKSIIHPLTGEVIETAAMTEHELQMELALDK